MKEFPGTVLCRIASEHNELEPQCAGSSQLCCTNHSTFDLRQNQQADPFIKAPAEMEQPLRNTMSRRVTAETSLHRSSKREHFLHNIYSICPDWNTYTHTSPHQRLYSVVPSIFLYKTNHSKSSWGLYTHSITGSNCPTTWVNVHALPLVKRPVGTPTLSTFHYWSPEMTKANFESYTSRPRPPVLGTRYRHKHPQGPHLDVSQGVSCSSVWYPPTEGQKRASRFWTAYIMSYHLHDIICYCH